MKDQWKKDAMVQKGTPDQTNIRKDWKENAMVQKAAPELPEINRLDSTIQKLYPSLKEHEVMEVRSKLIGYISDGLETGHHVGLIKPVGDDQISIKALRLTELEERPKLNVFNE